MAFATRLSAPRLLQAVAVFVALAGVVTWSSLLLTRAESSAPAAVPPMPAPRSDNPSLQWFSSQPAAVSIKVSGVMAGAHGSVAVLSINDGPPRSVIPGERLTQGVRLVAIEADGVVIEQGSQRTQLKVGTLPDSVALPSLIRR